MAHRARPAALVVSAGAIVAGLMGTGSPMVMAEACVQPRAVGDARTDQHWSGDRRVDGCSDLGDGVTDYQLPISPWWVIPDPDAAGEAWLVAAVDGTVVRVGPDGIEPIAGLRPGAPPMAFGGEGGPLRVVNARRGRGQFSDPLPDAHVARWSGFLGAALVGPTDRYGHGVLGDAIEASALEIADDVGGPFRIEVAPHEVIEGLSPMLADLHGDAEPEALVTVSDASEGARLRVYSLDGTVVAESDPVGQGYRWVHQVGVGATGPDGEIEIIAVRTPHIGGIVEAYQLRDGRLEKVATQAGYSTHRLGSRNLDMGLLADTDGDGRPEVVVPTQAMDELGLLARSHDGFAVLDTLELGGRLATNLAAVADADGALHLAAATEDGRLRVFG